MITALGEHFTNNPAVTLVAASFANCCGEDWGVPHTPPDIVRWLALGYTSEKMLDAGRTIIDATMTALEIVSRMLCASQAVVVPTVDSIPGSDPSLIRFQHCTERAAHLPLPVIRKQCCERSPAYHRTQAAYIVPDGIECSVEDSRRYGWLR